MKRTQTQFQAGVFLASIVLGLMPVAAMASTYLPVGYPGVDHVYSGVPFEIWGIWIDTKHTEDQFIPVSSWDLSPYGTAKELHIIQYCAWADNVPTGVTVGHITVFYQDESTSSLDLIVGVNTAEWSYDNFTGPYAECLKHEKVTPAFSYDTGEGYDGHHFYVSISLEAKPLDRIELALDPASYTDDEWFYGCAPWDWFGVTITGLTIEYPPIPAGLDIDPDTLNLKSKGKWITAYLSPPEGFDVADIDAESIRLNGQIPAAWSLMDEEAQVLIVKFARAAVAEIVETGDEVQMTVAGIVGGDTKFEGTDVVRVIN